MDTAGKSCRSGLRGVTNKIAIKPGVDSSNVKSKIESALKRHAEVEAKAIRVTVQNGSKAVLEGKVTIGTNVARLSMRRGQQLGSRPSMIA
jgi:osmotically-inducible protein OsmY